MTLPDHVPGEKIRPLLATPKAEWNFPVPITHCMNNHSIRTRRWRYIRYANGDEQLYGHSQHDYEFNNLAKREAELDSVKRELVRVFPKLNKPPAKSRGAIGEAGAAMNSAVQPAK